MNIGDAVRVLNKRYEDLPCDVTGEIFKVNPTWLHPYGVRVNEYANPKSANGLYYFDTDELFEMDMASMYPSTLFSSAIDDAYINIKFGIKENKIMKNKQLIKGYKKAIVKFYISNDEYGIPKENSNGEEGVLYALYDEDIEVGNFVLCANEYEAHKIGQITKIFENDAEIDVRKCREIICKIDYSKYVERQERLKKIEKLKTAMAKKKEELNELAVYQTLAATSPEMAEMLEELKELL